MKNPLPCIGLVLMVVSLLGAPGACSNVGTGDSGADNGTRVDAGERGSDGPGADGHATSIVVVTFNTGTTEGMGKVGSAYTPQHATNSDRYYGDGLAWMPAVEETKAFFARLQPDIVAFQEIFHSPECASVPADAKKDFICETWKPGDPTVAQIVLGAGYQVMCHPGKPDKCAAVKRSFGTFRGCKEDLCLDGLAGFKVDDCGGGSRVGRGVIDLKGSQGGSITLVSYHGSSGIKDDDVGCRVKQVEQVFVDLGDGKPGASGNRNLILGDFNTDPARGKAVDKSAQRWNDFVGPGKGFHFISEVGLNATPTYSGLMNIDHLVSDVATGSCWVAGVSPGHPPVIDTSYFDHKPIVCTVKLP